MKKGNAIGILTVLVIWMVLMSGCTSSQSTPTSDVTVAPTTTIITTLTTSVQTAAPAQIVTNISTTITTGTPTSISITGTPMNDVLAVSLNSAEKTVSLGNKIGKPGFILLVLDITIKNNDKRNDFTYSDASFVITDKTNNDRVTAMTSQKALPLTNPLFMGTIPVGSTDDGKILFKVNATSSTFTLSVVDSTGTVLGSIDNIYVP